jgi:Helix-turn-helix domain
MSWQLLAWATEQRTGGGTRKAVLIALANRASHDTGRCFPSVATISRETEIGRTAVKAALVALVEQGLITRERRRRADGSLGTYEYAFPHVETASDLEPGGDPGLEPGGDLRPGPRGDPLNQEEPNRVEHATANAVAREPATARTILAAYIDHEREQGHDPPTRVRGQLARLIGELLDEGQPPEHVVGALRLLSERRLHPATLPSLIAEAAKGAPRRTRGTDVQATIEAAQRGIDAARAGGGA